MLACCIELSSVYKIRILSQVQFRFSEGFTVHVYFDRCVDGPNTSRGVYQRPRNTEFTVSLYYGNRLGRVGDLVWCRTKYTLQYFVVVWTVCFYTVCHPSFLLYQNVHNKVRVWTKVECMCLTFYLSSNHLININSYSLKYNTKTHTWNILLANREAPWSDSSYGETVLTGAVWSGGFSVCHYSKIRYYQVFV